MHLHSRDEQIRAYLPLISFPFVQLSMRALRGVRKLKCVNYADDDRSRKMVGMRELFRCRVVAAVFFFV